MGARISIFAQYSNTLMENLSPQISSHGVANLVPLWTSLPDNQMMVGVMAQLTDERIHASKPPLTSLYAFVGGVSISFNNC